MTWRVTGFRLAAEWPSEKKNLARRRRSAVAGLAGSAALVARGSEGAYTGRAGSMGPRHARVPGPTGRALAAVPQAPRSNLDPCAGIQLASRALRSRATGR